MSNLIKTLKGSNLNNIEENYQDSKVYPVTLSSAVFTEEGEILQDVLNRILARNTDVAFVHSDTLYDSRESALSWVFSIADKKNLTVASFAYKSSGGTTTEMIQFKGTSDQWSDKTKWTVVLSIFVKDQEVTASQIGSIESRISNIESRINVDEDHDKKDPSEGISWGNCYDITSDYNLVIPNRITSDINYIAFDIEIDANTEYSFTLQENVYYTKDAHDHTVKSGNTYSINTKPEKTTYRISIDNDLLDVKIIYKNI